MFMSTHILADVERICDVIGIIDKGRLIVEEQKDKLRDRFAPPVFELRFEGDSESMVESLQSLAWVSAVEAEQHGSETELRVRISDVTVAKRELPRIMAESGLILLHYEMVAPSLEDVFIGLLEKGSQS